MRKFILLFVLEFWLVVSAQAQLDTSRGRFQNFIFDSVVVNKDILYTKGINAQGQSQNLFMDIYTPKNDTMKQRPVIVLAHGGGFIQGSKADLQSYCNLFARKGFVTVSMQYRLGPSSISSTGITQMVIRASQDMKNALRFLNKSISNGNPYGLHKDYFFAGGLSAGAITALHVAYLDELIEIPAGQNIGSLDSLNNVSAFPGTNYKIKAIINIAGAIGDTNWIKPGNLPVISLQGTADNVVPYQSGIFGIPFSNQSITLYGSLSIFKRATALGIPTDLRPFQNAEHDYTQTYSWAADTTEKRITRFLFPFLLNTTTSSRNIISKINWPVISKNERCIFISKTAQVKSVAVFYLDGRKEAEINETSIRQSMELPEGKAFILHWRDENDKVFTKLMQ